MVELTFTNREKIFVEEGRIFLERLYNTVISTDCQVRFTSRKTYFLFCAGSKRQNHNQNSS